MPLLSVARVLFAVISLVVLALAGYLAWSWYDGDLVRTASGAVYFTREAWRLWAAIGLGAWSLLGRWVIPRLVSRKDRNPTLARRDGGRTFHAAGGDALYVEQHGPQDGVPILLTHGWGLDSTIWEYARRDLGRRFRLILWDLPGMGRSRLARGHRLSLDGFARDLGSVIELAKGRPVVLVGHSIGGMTIQTLARQRPELFGREIAGVVLVNTTYTNPLKTMLLRRLAQALRWPLIEPMMWATIVLQPLAWLSAWQSYLSGWAHLANRLGFGRYATLSQLEHTTLLTTRNPPGVSARGNLAMFRWDAAAALPKIGCPVLVLTGSMDIVTRPEASRHIASLIPHAELREVEHVNHMGFLERADLYNRAIADFAETVQTATAETVAPPQRTRAVRAAAG